VSIFKRAYLKKNFFTWIPTQTTVDARKKESNLCMNFVTWWKPMATLATNPADFTRDL
jgi:cytosine/uracil/thiamine/allantoin permease